MAQSQNSNLSNTQSVNRLNEIMFENELTSEYVREHFKDILLTFEHYYKYVFTFIGYITIEPHKDYKIIAKYGGDSDDIYRFEVDMHKPEKMMELDSYNFVEIFKYDDTFPPTYWKK